MPRVLWLFELPALHGAERSLLACLDAVRAAGFEVVAAAPAEGPLAEELARLGVEQRALAIHDRTGKHRPPEAIDAEMALLIAQVAPDLVHANSLAMGRISSAAVAASGVLSIAHLRDIIKVSGAAMEQLNEHTRLLAVSQATHDYHIVQGLDPWRAHVLHNGVDLTRFRPSAPTGALHRELGINPKHRLLGTIGQIGMRKGQDTLVEAFIEIAETLTDCHLVVVGHRTSKKREAVTFEKALHERLAKARLGGRAHFIGVRDDVARILPELAVVVHPARQEPLGRVLLEAAACGRPIVATDVGGTSEIFPRDSDAAVLAPPDDPVMLEFALREPLMNGDRAARLGSAARRRAEAAFDIRMAAEGLVRHYREVLG